MKTIRVKTSFPEKLAGVLLEKCPYCNKGHIFKAGKKFPFQLPDMKEYCDACNEHLDREPGYFLGAMYVSYALAVGQGIVAYLLSVHVLNIQSTGVIIGLVIFVILALQNKNFRMARVIWMHLFGY